MNKISAVKKFLNKKATMLSVLFSVSALSFSVSDAAHADYSNHVLAKEFIDSMVSEHGFTAEGVKSILAKAEKKQSILDAIARPAEKTKTWKEYRRIFLGEKRINQGVEFWDENAKTIQKASEEYGVAPEVIVAIIGVETRYGRHAGNYRVLDALSTLAFDYPKRSKFFTKELRHYLVLTREQKKDPEALFGSYAGAMGYGQFMPSSFQMYAVDFDSDELKDIWNNPTDAIGSVANYFKRHGWKSGEPVLARARISGSYSKEALKSRGRPSLTINEVKKLGFNPVVKGYNPDDKVMPLLYKGGKGKEFWLGYNNYYVITRYNRSQLYAMAVWQLSNEIKDKYTKSLP